MKIDKETIEQIAKLAHLELGEAEAPGMISDLNKILAWMDMLKEVDTQDILPLSHPAFEINQLRKDEVGNTLERSQALDLAPKKDHRYFKVPKVKEIND